MTEFQAHLIELPSPGPGTTRSIRYYRFGESGARPGVYIQTALHADEIPGMLVLHHLLRRLEAAEISGEIAGEIVVVPVANPVGMAQRVWGRVAGRMDLNSGKNFNRHYPDLLETLVDELQGKLTGDAGANVDLVRAAMHRAVSALPEDNESDALRKALLSLSVGADYCIDLHCDNEAVLYMYAGMTHGNAVRDLSAQLGCEALILARESGGDPFDESNSELWTRLARRFPDYPIPASCLGCTVELRGERDVSDALAEKDADGLFRFLVNEGVIAGEKRPIPGSSCPAHPLEGVSRLSAPAGGVVVFHRECGDFVEAGEVIAEIVDPLQPGDSGRRAVTSDIDGIMFARESQRLVAPGQSIASISGEIAIPGQAGTHMLGD